MKSTTNMLRRSRQIMALASDMGIKDEEDIKAFEQTNIIGDEAYRIMMSTRKQKTDKLRLDEILITTGVSNEEFRLIKEGSRKRGLTKYKQRYIKKAIELKYTHKEIGENISITDASVRDLLKRE